MGGILNEPSARLNQLWTTQTIFWSICLSIYVLFSQLTPDLLFKTESWRCEKLDPAHPKFMLFFRFDAAALLIGSESSYNTSAMPAPRS